MRSIPCRVSALILILASTASVAPAARADGPAPCDVLTLADVKAVLGPPWMKNEDFSAGESCAYQAAPAATVAIILTSAPSGAAAMLEGRRKLAGAKAQPAPGPGEGAYRVTTPNAIAIVFGKGDHVAQVEATPAATHDWAVLDKLAQAAYGRLP